MVIQASSYETSPSHSSIQHASLPMSLWQVLLFIISKRRLLGRMMRTALDELRAYFRGQRILFMTGLRPGFQCSRTISHVASANR